MKIAIEIPSGEYCAVYERDFVPMSSNCVLLDRFNCQRGDGMGCRKHPEYKLAEKHSSDGSTYIYKCPECLKACGESEGDE